MIKQFILLLTLLAFSFSSMAQRRPSESLNDRDLGMYYLQKNRKQKITGWVLLGGGFLLSTVALNSLYSVDGSGSGEALYVASSVAMIASIPVFISAAKNKGRAEILLRNENVPMSFSTPAGSKLTSVGIAFPLGGR